MRRSVFQLLAVGLGCVSVFGSCKKTEQAQQPSPPAPPPAARAVATTSTSAPVAVAPAPARFALPAEAPDAVRVALAGDATDGVVRRLTGGWSSGRVAFVPDRMVFTIARDYDQVLAVQVHNLTDQPQKVLAVLADFGGGLIGDFSGDGAVRPLELAGGKTAVLALHLFAQDATRTNYRSAVILKDAASGVALASAPITVFVPQPNFSLQVTLGEQDPATLARTVTVHNNGEALTDFAVGSDGPLAGHAVIKPGQEHVYLAAGADVSFRVVPVLDTGFTGVAGPIVLSGAGQEQRVDISLPLPPGKHVFVASSFSNSNDQANGGYCTNNPNTNTPMGGPQSPGDDPWQQMKQDLDNMHNQMNQQYDNPNMRTGPPSEGGGGPGNNPGDNNKSPFDKFNDWLNGHLPALPIPGLPINTSGRGSFDKSFGPVEIKGDYGPAPGSDPSGPLIDVHWTVTTAPLPGIPGTSTSGTTTVSINQNVQNNLDPNSSTTPGGSILNGAEQPQSSGAAHASPRGLRVRPAYAHFRENIYVDNEPEAICDVGPADPAERYIYQVWHSDRWCGGKGSQVLLRVWDGLGQRALTRTIAISDKTLCGHWPTVLALPGGQVLVVWESSAKWSDPPSLMYRFGGNGFASWTRAAPLPGADAQAGNFDPQAVLTPDGSVLVLWQQGTGQQARLMSARSDEHGAFKAAVAAQGLPAQVTRPTARFLADGNLCLIFQAPPPTAEAGVATAVYAALSKDGGVSFDNETRLSPANTDAGEADLLVSDKTTEVAMRVGPSWQSSIALASSGDGGKTWSDPHTITDPSLYAEYPSLSQISTGVQLSFYGDLRSNAPTPETAATRPAGVTPAARAVLKRFAMTQADDGAFAPMRRLLTQFPTSQIGWLQVNFRLRFPRRDFSPHEVSILLNNVELLHQTDVIPEGNYLLPFSPALLAQDSQGRPHNVVSLRTVHMNPGHYASAAQFRLQVHHRFLERLIVAGTQEEADSLAAAESEDVNHARSDVGIFARPSAHPVALPATPALGQVISLPLTVANLGESPARNAKVRVFAGDGSQSFKLPPVGDEINLATLDSFDLKDVEVKFPYGGASAYRAVVSSDAGDPAQPEAASTATAPNQRDFDLGNNVFQVSFVLPQPPNITPRAPDTSSELVADLDDDPAPPYGWRVLDAQSGKDVATVSAGRASVSITPGSYKLALKRFQYEGEEEIFPAVFEKKPDQPIDATIHTAIEIELPPLMKSIFQWRAVDAAHPDRVVQHLAGSHRVMLLPPGDYRVAMEPTPFDSKWVMWPQTVHLEARQHQVLKLDSGVMPPDGLASAPPPYSWGLWPQGKPDAQPVQNVLGAWTGICVPPGTYQWGIRLAQWDSTTVIFPEVLNVDAGRIVRPGMPGMLTLLPEKWSVPYAVKVVDAKDGRVAQEVTGASVVLTELLPAGEYRLKVKPFQWNGMEITLPQTLRLTSGGTLKVPLNTGIDVQPANTGREEPPPYQFSFTREGDAKPTQVLADRNWGPVLLPGGRYHITLRPRHWQGQEVVWPTLADVIPGQLSAFTIDSGIHLTGLSAEEVKNLSFRIMSIPPPATTQGAAATQPAAAPGEPTLAQSGFDAMQTQWLPPGTYGIQVQDGAGAWQNAADQIHVSVGRVVDVPVAAPHAAATTPSPGGIGVRRN